MHTTSAHKPANSAVCDALPCDCSTSVWSHVHCVLAVRHTQDLHSSVNANLEPAWTGLSCLFLLCPQRPLYTQTFEKVHEMMMDLTVMVSQVLSM